MAEQEIKIMADLVKLKTFLYAAENMSFSEAAKHLHLTEPTISHHIKTLEQTLGVALFLVPNLLECPYQLAVSQVNKLQTQSNRHVRIGPVFRNSTKQHTVTLQLIADCQ